MSSVMIVRSIRDSHASEPPPPPFITAECVKGGGALPSPTRPSCPRLCVRVHAVNHTTFTRRDLHPSIHSFLPSFLPAHCLVGELSHSVELLLHFVVFFCATRTPRGLMDVVRRRDNHAERPLLPSWRRRRGRPAGVCPWAASLAR